MRTMQLKYTRYQKGSNERTYSDIWQKVLIGDASWGPTASHMAVKVGIVDQTDSATG